MKNDLLFVSGYLFSDSPLKLRSGHFMNNIQVAYTINGALTSNAKVILVLHALTGDQYVASKNPITGRKGWWPDYVGSGKVIDTDIYCVICTNILGGCMGTTGPTTEKTPESEELWGGDFPVITIQDMVNVQQEFLKNIGVNNIFAIVGGSMGGMQVLEWLRLFPEITNKFLILASSYRQSVQNIGFHEIGRKAIQLDPMWASGNYLKRGIFPNKGLKIARMVAHMTYLSSNGLTEKFGRRLQGKNVKGYSLEEDFQLESYLNYQGDSFTERFDPCSYIYITKAVDYFDQSEDFFGDLKEAYSEIREIKKKSIDLISFDSDWLYPTSEMETIYDAVTKNGGTCTLTELSIPHGHDSFLLKDASLEKKIFEILK
jgi:homoserine O-acetyltransferase